MLELAAVFAAALPLFVIFNDDEVYFQAQIAPANASPAMIASEYTQESIIEHVRERMIHMIVVSGGEHLTAPTGLVKESLSENVAHLLHITDEVNALREMFGEDTQDLTISLSVAGDTLRWSASLSRLPRGPVFQFSEEFRVEEFDKAIDATAKWAMRLLDSLTLLKYEYVVGTQSGSFAGAWEEVEFARHAYGGQFDGLIEDLVGMMHLWEGNVPAANAAFRLAIQLDASLAEARLNLALTEASRGRRMEAETILDTVVKTRRSSQWGRNDPVTAAAIALKSLILDNAGRADLAIATLQEAVDADPTLPEIHELAAAVLRGRGYGAFATHHDKVASSLRLRHPTRLSHAFLDARRIRELLPMSYQTASQIPARRELATDVPSGG